MRNAQSRDARVKTRKFNPPILFGLRSGWVDCVEERAEYPFRHDCVVPPSPKGTAKAVAPAVLLRTLPSRLTSCHLPPRGRLKLFAPKLHQTDGQWPPLNSYRGGESLPIFTQVARDCALRIANCALKKPPSGGFLRFIRK